MSTIYLIEISGYNPNTLSVETLRFSTRTGYNHSSAPGFYDPRVLQPGTFQRSAFAAGKTGGSVDIGYGSVVILNNDGAWDNLRTWGFDGRTIRILQGLETQAYNTFTVFVQGVVEQIRMNISQIEFLIRDKVYAMTAALQPVKFLGNNVGANGLEGGEDLKGKPKPILFGTVENFSPVQVNASKLIYMLHTGSVVSSSVLAYASGGLLARGTDYSSLLDMQANEPAPDTYRLFSSSTESYIRLGFNPAGQITVNATQNAAAVRADQIINLIATTYLQLSGPEISSADLAAMASANSTPLGRYVTEETTIKEAMEYFALGVGAWFGFDTAGVLRSRILVAPSGTPSAVFKRLGGAEIAESNTINIVDIELSTTEDFGSGLPNWQTQLEWALNPTVMQDSGIAQSVQGQRRLDLKSASRTAVSTNLAVLTPHPEAIEYKTRMPTWNAVGAQAEANRIQTLRGVLRDYFVVTAQLGTFPASTLDLGSIVELRLPRFGLSNGKLFVVLGITVDPAKQVVQFALWG